MHRPRRLDGLATLGGGPIVPEGTDGTTLTRPRSAVTRQACDIEREVQREVAQEVQWDVMLASGGLTGAAVGAV